MATLIGQERIDYHRNCIKALLVLIKKFPTLPCRKKGVLKKGILVDDPLVTVVLPDGNVVRFHAISLKFAGYVPEEWYSLDSNVLPVLEAISRHRGSSANRSLADRFLDWSAKRFGGERCQVS